jgi:hypothetical protein
VQPKLGARVRLLAAGDTNKNDPNDARSVAVAALRSPGVREVVPDDHAAVLKIWSKRYRDLGRTRTQVVCRLHAVLCELVPGGVAKAIRASAAARLLDSITPAGAVDTARCELAAAFLEDLRRIDAQLRETRKTLTTAVQAAGTSLTGLFGVGPVNAAQRGRTTWRHGETTATIGHEEGPPAKIRWPGHSTRRTPHTRRRRRPTELLDTKRHSFGTAIGLLGLSPLIRARSSRSARRRAARPRLPRRLA